MNGRLREGPKRLSPLPLVHPVTFVSSRAPSAPANRREGRAKSCCSVKPTLGARFCVPRSPRRSPRRRSGSESTRATDSVLQRRRTDTFVPGGPSCRAGELEPPSVGGARFLRWCRAEARLHPTQRLLRHPSSSARDLLGVGLSQCPRTNRGLPPPPEGSHFQPGAFHHLVLRTGALCTPSSPKRVQNAFTTSVAGDP